MVRLLKFSAALCTLAAALSVVAGPAAARRLPFKIARYKVTYKGTGTYSVKQSDGPSHGEVSSQFHWTAHYDFIFIDKGGSQVAAITDKKQTSGGGTWSIASDNGGGDVCTKTGGLKLNQMGSISGAVQKSSGKVIMHLIPGSNDFATTDGSSGSQACDTTDFWHDWVESFSHVGTSEETFDPLTAFVTLSKKELKFGKVVVNVSNHTLAAPSLTVDPDCGSGNGATCTQSYDWKGTVTFLKKR